MIAPLDMAVEKEVDIHTSYGTLIYYGNHMNNGLNGLLSSIVLRNGLKPTDIADIKQDVALSLVEMADKKPTKRIDNPPQYIAGTCRNACRLYWRKRNRRIDNSNYGLEFDGYSSPTKGNLLSAVEYATRNEKCMWVLRALQKMGKMRRELLLLHYFHGMPYSQVGEILGIPMGTAQSRTHRALNALREELQDKL